MSKKLITFFLVLSMLFTFSSPTLFPVYVEGLPDSFEKKVLYGVPFPFIEQTVLLPTDADQYPLEVKYSSGYEKRTTFKFIPFLLSLVAIFLFFTSIMAITIRFFKKR